MSAQSDLSVLRADEATAQAAYDAAAQAFRAAEVTMGTARTALRDATKARERAEILADYHALTPDQQAALSGPCPQGRDAKWWINRGWVDRGEDVWYGRTHPTWTWGRKRRLLQEFLEQP